MDSVGITASGVGSGAGGGAAGCAVGVLDLKQIMVQLLSLIKVGFRRRHALRRDAAFQ